MSLAFVLMFWAAAGAIIAALGSAMLAGLTALLTRRREPRKPLVAFAAALPFAALAWTACVFVGQAIVNEVLLGRDLGLGDGFYCPLPNGYTISMIDVLDHASILESPHGQSIIGDVREIQVSDRYVFGATQAPSWYSDNNPELVSAEQAFFVLDSVTRELRRFASSEELAEHVRGLGRPLELESIAAAYSRYRPTWFDYLAITAMVSFPIGGIVMLVGRIFRFRRSHSAITPAPA